MAEDKLFFKYQSLKPADYNGNDTIYTIVNLANNQLFFNNPTKFNDPFDCKFALVQIGTRKQWINDYERVYNHIDAIKLFNHNLKYGLLKKEQDGLYSYDFIKGIKLNIERGLLRKEDYIVYNDSIGESRKQIGIDLNDYLRSKALPSVSCFSGTDGNILMWSHYADYHKGICLRFRSYKHVFKVNENVGSDFLINSGYVKPNKEYYLLDLYRSTNKLLTSNVFYEIEYKHEPPESVNYFDTDKDAKIVKFLITKYTDWIYENEYRLVVDNEIPENELLKYNKGDLEGVIFGLKIGYNDAKLVYDTIKVNYLDKGINVNFYEAKEVIGRYEVKPELITDVEKYLDELQ